MQVAGHHLDVSEAGMRYVAVGEFRGVCDATGEERRIWAEDINDAWKIVRKAKWHCDRIWPVMYEG